MPKYEYRQEGEHYSVWEHTDDGVVWQAYHSKYPPYHAVVHSQRIAHLKTPTGTSVLLAHRIDNTFVEVYNTADGIVEIKAGYCARCLLWDNVFFDVFGYLCSRCLPLIGTCRVCNKGHWIHKYHGTILCTECYAKRIRTCDNCGNTFEEATGVWYHVGIFCSDRCADSLRNRRKEELMRE